MKSKKKVIIAMSSLVAVFAIAIVAVTAVLAARNGTVNSGFTIQYTAIHVKATITGSYQVYNNASPTALEPATITFAGTEATDGTNNVKTFTSVTPVLKSVNDSNDNNTEKAYVDFVYVITNNETTGGNLMDIVLASDPDTADNNLDYTYTVAVSGGSASNTGTTYNNLVTGLQPGATATITIRVQVHDLDTNVNASGTFAFVLTGVAPAPSSP